MTSCSRSRTWWSSTRPGASAWGARATGWDVLSGGADEAAGESVAPDQDTLRERLERRAREEGWFTVRAEHLLDDAPSFRLSELVVGGLDRGLRRGPRVRPARHRALLAPLARPSSADGDADLARRRRAFRGRPGPGVGRRRRRRDPLCLARALGRRGARGACAFPARAAARGRHPRPRARRLLGRGSDRMGRPCRCGPPSTTRCCRWRASSRRRSTGSCCRSGSRGPLDAPRIRFEHSTFLDARGRGGESASSRNACAAARKRSSRTLAERAGVEIPEGLAGRAPGEPGRGRPGRGARRAGGRPRGRARGSDPRGHQRRARGTLRPPRRLSPSEGPGPLGGAFRASGGSSEPADRRAGHGWPPGALV